MTTHRYLFIPGLGFDASFSQLLPFPCISFDDVQAKATSSISDNTILIGWSLGAIAAIQLAAKLPHAVKKLIILAGSPAFQAKEGWPGISKTLACELSEMLEKYPEKFDDYFLSLLSFPTRNRVMRKKLQTLYKRPSITLLNLLFQTDARAQFANLRLPIQLYLGAKDAILPNQPLIEACQALNPFVTATLISHASHLFFVDQPDFFHEVV